VGRCACVVALALTRVIVTLDAQTPKPTFEVASVKPNLSGSWGFNVSPRPGFYSATNVPVAVLIQFAYDLQDYQLVGGPGWALTARFDIAARPGREVPTMEQRLMMQSLLEDRFKLVMHTEQREMPVFALVLARSDGRLGPNLRRMPDDCVKVKTGANGCGPISVVVNSASRQLRAPVIDKTGLTGLFNFSLHYSSDGTGPPFLPPIPSSPDRPADDPNAPSYTAALQEQLGLKLESSRGPVDVLVIDSVQQPTEN
jgi:uncharacterized protein (TIGR03435 family)